MTLLFSTPIILFGLLAFVLSTADAVLKQDTCVFVDTRSKNHKRAKELNVDVPCDQLEEITHGIWKETQLSSVQSRYHRPDKAIDGNDNTWISSKYESHPWWMINLGSKRTILAIMIFPRQGRKNLEKRYRNVEIRLGDRPNKRGNFRNHDLLQYFEGPYTRSQSTLMYQFPDKPSGQFLSIKIIAKGHHNLQISEVKILALKK